MISAWPCAIGTSTVKDISTWTIIYQTNYLDYKFTAVSAISPIIIYATYSSYIWCVPPMLHNFLLIYILVNVVHIKHIVVKCVLCYIYMSCVHTTTKKSRKYHSHTLIHCNMHHIWFHMQCRSMYTMTYYSNKQGISWLTLLACDTLYSCVK